MRKKGQKWRLARFTAPDQLISKVESCLSPFLLISAVFLFFTLPAYAALTASAVVRPNRVTAGEPLTLEISVTGEQPMQPDISHLKTDFTVSGPQTGHSTNVSWINGRMTSNERYTLTYQLVPRKTGTLTIPSIAITAGGRTVRTQPVSVTVVKASGAGKIDFFVGFDKQTCYVGEVLVMTVKVSSTISPMKIERVNLPIVEDARFDVITNKTGPYDGKFYAGAKLINGENFSVHTAKVLVIPKEAANFRLEGCSVSCRFQVGWKKSRDFFDDFFSRGRTPDYRRRVVVADPVELTVKPFPEANKPADFSGIIGRPVVETTARPTEVSVGQPIDFVVRISGLPYLGNVSPITVGKQPEFAADFKVQDDGLGGSIEGGSIVFRRTVRAKNDRVQRIPSFKLAYFDTRTGEYDYAASRPIPLKVNPTKIITFEDTPGMPVTHDRIGPETLAGGIAGNEIGMDVIEDQYFAAAEAIRSPGWLAAAALPLVAYLVLLAHVTISEKRRCDEDGIRARRAFGRAKKALRVLGKDVGGANPSRLTRIIYDYIGERLTRNPASLTPSESARFLEEAGVPEKIRVDMERLLSDLEAARFGGASGEEEILLNKARDLIRILEKLI